MLLSNLYAFFPVRGPCNERPTTSFAKGIVELGEAGELEEPLPQLLSKIANPIKGSAATVDLMRILKFFI